MPHFRYLATDAGGQRVNGYIDAPSEGDAVGRLWRRGLRTESIDQLDAAPLPEPPPPREPDPFAPPESRDRFTRPPSRPVAWVTLLLASLALLASVAALAVTLLREGGRGLAGYDLSTPEAALKATFVMREKGDFKAMLEWSNLEDDIRASTLAIKRVADFKEKKILFFSITRKGKEAKMTAVFERDDSGRWRRSHMSTFTIRRTDEKLSREMEQWSRFDDD